MGNAVILPNERVENRLARSGVPHRRRESGKHRPFLGIVLVEQGLVDAEAYRGRDVVPLGFADQRVDKKPVSYFQRYFRQVLVGPMNRIASLKSGDAAPATGGDNLSDLAR